MIPESPLSEYGPRQDCIACLRYDGGAVNPLGHTCGEGAALLRPEIPGTMVRASASPTRFQATLTRVPLASSQAVTLRFGSRPSAFPSAPLAYRRRRGRPRGSGYYRSHEAQRFLDDIRPHVAALVAEDRVVNYQTIATSWGKDPETVSHYCCDVFDVNLEHLAEEERRRRRG
jgi:hypothetical protein